MKKILKILLWVVAALLVIAAAYFAYVLLAYHRIPDNQTIAVSGSQTAAAQTEQDYQIVSYNIGFGAYEPDYSFFMDGGTESWAWSKERLSDNMARIGEILAGQQADFYFVEEVDAGSTRTYHRDERADLTASLSGYNSLWAQNYDSPFLFYPITQPHGKSVSGIMTFSKLQITSSVRRSLPVETGLMKMVDLDRCYSVSRVPVENGAELVLYAVHLSAYSSDGTIAVEQLRLLLADMQAERDKGNYVVCGGDFNKDLLDTSAEVFGVSGEGYTWAQRFPTELLEGTDMTLVTPYDPAHPVPTCRNADAPYHEGQFVLTIDGFMVSDNVEVSESHVIDTGFSSSDHNPVHMTFSLKSTENG